jgi:transposase InsO family protein
MPLFPHVSAFAYHLYGTFASRIKIQSSPLPTGDLTIRFLSVPTITFGMLYCFFISHDRRHILHFNVTRHPTSAWIAQQLREAFPYKPVPEFMILDHDSKYGSEVSASLRVINIKAVPTAVACPWQNGVAERWVGGNVTN